MIRSALERQETRGVHFRADFPEADPRWKSHLAWHRGTPGPRVEPLVGGA
jgi:succinate dehydrogenase/fumarate reductase flavoprotein subunit